MTRRIGGAGDHGMQPSGPGRALLSGLVDFLLPPLCLACRERVEGDGGLCPACWGQIDFIRPPVCERLGIPLPYAGDEPLVSAAAFADPPVYGRARAAARFNGVMRDLIHALKYRDRQEGVTLFAHWLADAGATLLGEADLLVPVPLYRGRLWRRRVNQAALLAGAVSSRTEVPVAYTMLNRCRPTQSQVGLTSAQRQRNVAGAFAVGAGTGEQLRGRHIILIDDVITTGATVNACARTLTRAGAAQVDVLALARVVDPLAPNL